MNNNIFLFLFTKIILLNYLKCQILLREEVSYFNLFVIEKDEICLLAFNKDSFGNFNIIREIKRIIKLILQI